MLQSELVVNPVHLGLAPSSYWSELGSGDLTFGQLVNNFFRADMSRVARFVYKLYDMLRLSESSARLKGVVGCSWITDTVFSVDFSAAAALLNASQQKLFEMFTSLHFVEINEANFVEAGLGAFPEIAGQRVRLFFHREMRFVRRALDDGELDEIERACARRRV